MVRARAVVIPHAPSSEMVTNSVESNFSAESVSTLGVTVRLLKPGESAATVGSQYPRLPATGIIRTTPTPDGCQRLHVNVPNWIHLMVRQERYVNKMHADIPVWFDPSKDRIWKIDKDRLIEEQQPNRTRGIELWNKYGMTDGDPSTLVDGPRDESTQVDLGGAIGDLVGKFSESLGVSMPVSQASSTSTGDGFDPNMLDHPPVEGVGFDKWVEVSAALVKNRIAPQAAGAFAESMGVPSGQWQTVDSTWNDRIRSDWKLGAKYGEAYEAAMKRK